MPSALATAFVRVRADTAGFSRELATGLQGGSAVASAEGAKAGTSWSTAFNKSGIVKAANKLSEGLIAAAGASVYMAAKFQSAMEKIHTQAGVSQKDIKGLGDGILKLSGQVGFSPDSLAESLYHVESAFSSLGISGPKALALVKIAAEGAAVGGADLVDVTNALTAFEASGIKGAQNMSKAMGIMNAIVGAGDMKMSDLADAFGTGILASIKGFGVTIQDAGAALAVFGDNNIRGAKAGTQLRMAIQALAAPTRDGKALLEGWGLSVSVFAKDMQQGGLKLALEDLQKQFIKVGLTGKEQGQALVDLFGKRAGVGIQILLGQMDRLESKYPALAKGAGTFGDAWAKTQATAQQQMKELGHGFEAMGVSIGEKLLPPLMKVMSWISGHVSTVTHLAIAIGATALAISGLSVGIKAFNIVMGLWRGAMLIATGAQWELNVAMDANPIGIVILALAALVAALVYAYTHFKWFHDAVNFIWKQTIHDAELVWGALKFGFDHAWAAIKFGLKAFADVVLNIFGAIIHGAADAFGWVPTIGDKLKAAAKQFDIFHAAVDKALSFPPRTVDVKVAFLAGGASGPRPPGTHAAGGLITGGVPGQDSVPGLLMPGEVIVPTQMVRAGAVDHLRGQLPGFAGGGLVGGSFSGSTAGLALKASTPPVAVIDHAVYAAIQFLAQKNAQALFQASPGGMMAYAKSFVGTPYVWGGTTPAGWDCSGFSSFVYHHFGYPAPRTSQEQQLWARPSGDVPGALVFFYGVNGGASHVGLSFGNGTMVNASSPGVGTVISGTGGNTGFGIPPAGFDQGGWLMPGQTGINRTSRPERVTSARGEDAMLGRLDAIIGMLAEVVAAVDDNAPATAAGVARVLGGAAKSAHYASLYGA